MNERVSSENGLIGLFVGYSSSSSSSYLCYVIVAFYNPRNPQIVRLYGNNVQEKNKTKPHKYISKDDHDRKLHIIFPSGGEREMERKCKTAADDAKIQFIAARVYLWALEGDRYS